MSIAPAPQNATADAPRELRRHAGPPISKDVVAAELPRTELGSLYDEVQLLFSYTSTAGLSDLNIQWRGSNLADPDETVDADWFDIGAEESITSFPATSGSNVSALTEITGARWVSPRVWHTGAAGGAAYRISIVRSVRPGPTGATGPAGATGPQGPTGSTGSQGIQGIQGPAGAQGIQGIQGGDGAAGAAGQGVPVGGATAEILLKNSGTNYDTAWAAWASLNPWTYLQGTPQALSVAAGLTPLPGLVLSGLAAGKRYSVRGQILASTVIAGGIPSLQAIVTGGTLTEISLSAGYPQSASGGVDYVHADAAATALTPAAAMPSLGVLYVVPFVMYVEVSTGPVTITINGQATANDVGFGHSHLEVREVG